MPCGIQPMENHDHLRTKERKKNSFVLVYQNALKLAEGGGSAGGELSLLFTNLCTFL